MCSRRYGRFTFVDLAGSERLDESESKGVNMRETGHINKSLFNLGKVGGGSSALCHHSFKLHSHPVAEPPPGDRGVGQASGF